MKVFQLKNNWMGFTVIFLPFSISFHFIYEYGFINLVCLCTRVPLVLLLLLFLMVLLLVPCVSLRTTIPSTELVYTHVHVLGSVSYFSSIHVLSASRSWKSSDSNNHQQQPNVTHLWDDKKSKYKFLLFRYVFLLLLKQGMLCLSFATKTKKIWKRKDENSRQTENEKLLFN